MNINRFQSKGSIRTYICLCIAIILVVISFTYFSSKKCKTSFTLINKDFACGELPVIDKKGYASLQQDLEKYIQEQKLKGNVTEVAVYFRDLVNGPLFGINEFNNFAPASLLKLPFVLTYLKEAEELGPQILSESLLYLPTTPNFEQNVVPEENLKPGESYTIEDLLRRMISYSDNNASNLLAAHLESTGRENIIGETLLELGILAPDDPFDRVVSVRRYGSIFRGLYNVSLLNTENSNKVLQWLSDSKFTDGLVVGVPSSVKIAHKFGERLLEDGTRQFHDCGIVYYPENPYLACIMTHGNEYVNLQKTIQEISKMIYEEVDSRKL